MIEYLWHNINREKSACLVVSKAALTALLGHTVPFTIFVFGEESMSYIEQTIAPGEHVVYSTRLSSAVIKICVILGTLAGLTFGAGIGALAGGVSTAIATTIAALGIAVIAGWLAMHSSEFAVTNKRVLIKTGILNQRMLEIMLTKVESVEVRQSIFGGLWNYGTLLVGGTGSTKEPFQYIENPLEFRKHIQQQIEENRQAA